jgi:glycosyltransferase involved in cell wall biosynthesis
VGTIEPRKNLDLLLDLVESYELSMPVFICGRVGWKSRETISRLRKLNKLGKVVWYANATDKKVLELAAVSNLGLITSKNEGFGLPLLEFRNFGLSVVAPRIEVFVEIDNGFVNFYEPDNLLSLAQTCLESKLFLQNSDGYNIKSWEMFAEELCLFISGNS